MRKLRGWELEEESYQEGQERNEKVEGMGIGEGVSPPPLVETANPRPCQPPSLSPSLILFQLVVMGSAPGSSRFSLVRGSIHPLSIDSLL